MIRLIRCKMPIIVDPHMSVRIWNRTISIILKGHVRPIRIIESVLYEMFKHD